MTLQRKLLTVFTALALMALASAALTAWSSLQQYNLLDDLDEQYQQGLLLHRIRTASGTLFRRHALAVLVEAAHADAHFDELDGRIRDNLTRLGEHASKPDDAQMARRVRESYEQVVPALATALQQRDGDGATPPEALVRTAHERFEAFRDLVDESLERNATARKTIEARLGRMRDTVLGVVAISAFGTLCLVILLGAYVSSDMFRPLRELQEAIGAAARGDFNRRLDVDRDDELGKVVHTFHHMLEALSRGARPESTGTRPVPAVPTLDAPDVHRVLYDTVALLHRDMARRSIRVTIDAPEALPSVQIHRGHLREAVETIVQAALSNLPAGCRLWLRAEGTDDPEPALVIEVAHDGAPDEADGDEGETLPSLLPEETGGDPLLEARRLVDAHGGALDVQTLPGRGQRAVLRLPALAQRPSGRPSGSIPPEAAAPT